MATDTITGKRTISRSVAVKEFFGMDTKTAMAEIKPLMQSDRAGFDWLAAECAKALGVDLDPK